MQKAEGKEKIDWQRTVPWHVFFFTERFRQIERSSYPVVVGLFDETKRQILFRLRSWNLQSRGRSMLPIDSKLCNKVKKIVKNMNAQKYIEKS